MATVTELDTTIINSNDTLRQVVLFDCDCHTHDDAVLQITKATGCSDSQAVQYAKVPSSLAIWRYLPVLQLSVIR